jgi:hypothetical protein
VTLLSQPRIERVEVEEEEEEDFSVRGAIFPTFFRDDFTCVNQSANIPCRTRCVEFALIWISARRNP